jgi:phosphatidylserine decarboxylase
MIKEGYYFGLPPLALGVAAFFLRGYWRWLPLAGILLVWLSVFVFYFFRDPERVIPTGPGIIVSPADGRVVVVKDEEYAGRAGKRVSIFLAVWNVHVNRSPEAGIITSLEYRPGKFLAAWAAAASLENEQNIFTLATDSGELMFKQIAGYIARRVVSWKNPGEHVARGERVGVVRFGSRVDVWLPSDVEVVVSVGDNVNGGSSVLARRRVSSSVAEAEQDEVDAERDLAVAENRN